MLDENRSVFVIVILSMAAPVNSYCYVLYKNNSHEHQCQWPCDPMDIDLETDGLNLTAVKYFDISNYRILIDLNCLYLD